MSKHTNPVERIREARLNEPTGIALDAVALDMFSNVAARTGYGTPSLPESTEYELIRWSQNYWLMITLFRNHWISRYIVEKPAQDMTKAWPVLQSSKLKPDDIASFDRVIRNTMTAARIQTALKWGRLFGGAGALIVIDGHEGMLDKPLDLDQVTPGSYKGLIVFDRWSGITPGTEMNNDINYPVDFNLPTFYEVQGESGDTFTVHSSRILRFCGPDVPQPEVQAQMYWGISILEIVYEELRKRDNASFAILNLMFRANILGQKNEQLAQLLSGVGSSAQAADMFYKVAEAQNQLMSNQSLMITGKDGDFWSSQYSFAGMSEVYAQFQMDVAGAARIPVSILFGRTVTGLSQSNDADIRIYEQDIAQKQNEELRPQLDKLYPVICMSEFGEVPDDIDLMFPSIRVLTEEQKGDIAAKHVEAILAPFNVGLTSQKVTLQELKAGAETTGIFTNITDKDIKDAKDKPDDPMDMLDMGSEFDDDKPAKPKPDAKKKPKPKAKKGGKGKDSFVGSEFEVSGLPVIVETHKGDERITSSFRVTMPADYGFIKNTMGADGDEVDCYVGPNKNSKKVFVINQSVIGSDEFDEHKCMIGYDTEEDAIKDYMDGHTQADDVFISSVPMSMRQFKSWLNGDCNQPVANDSSVGLLDKIANLINLSRIS